ncbi:hypothetical protein FRB95_003275 [Tulasnella sp. JGI-2019a]|nr:hypothetical protein FRB95_003275 [Tulasnella sp. JGI-2019a]
MPARSIPTAPGKPARASVGDGRSPSASVLFHEGSRLPDPNHYTTLLTLKMLTNPWKSWLFGRTRATGGRPPTGEPFENISPPWGELDSDGNAASVEDVYDNPDSPGSETFSDDI